MGRGWPDHHRQRLFAELDFAIANTATPEIIEIFVRQPEGREVIEARWRTDPLRHLEPAASLERLDIDDRLDIAADRRVDPNGSKDRHFLA